MADGFAVENLSAIHDSNDETGNIVFAIGIKAGHLRRFSTDQCAACLFTGSCNALNDRDDDFRFQSTGGDIIHKEERFRTLHENVVDAVIHEVATHGVVATHHHSDL